MDKTYQVECTCGHINKSDSDRIQACEKCGSHISTNWKPLPLILTISEETKSRALTNLFDFFDRHNFYFGFYDGIVEPGYSDKPVILGNWNGRNDQPNWEKIGDWITDYFDYEIDWEDEWDGCSVCNKAVRTSPDSYGWEKSFYRFEYGDIVCHECIAKDESLQEEIIEELKNRTDKAVNSWFYEYLEKYGFICYSPDEYCKRFETGWYPGQNDDPVDVARNIENELPGYDYIFKIDGVGQFDVYWSVYLRKQEIDE